MAIGPHFKTLQEQAEKCELTKTELARVLIVDGLRDLVAGKIAYRRPGLEDAQ